jgi:transcription-repair coupling factor (superfamily II helicase)
MARELLLDALPLPDPGHPHVRWSQLHGSGLSLAAAEAAARHGGTVCVIAPSAAAADRIEHEVEFFGGAPVRRFPGYETLPYEPISPPQDLLADRLLCLYQLARGERLTLVVEAGALLDRLPPREFVVSRSLQLKVGDKLEHGAMIRTLTEHGYLRVEQVAEAGEFAVRGAVLDVFPTGGVQPVRIDLFDDEIESLRMFDSQTQLSSGKTDALRILPAREFPFDDPAIKAFRERFRDRFPVDPTRCPIYRMISEAQLPAGIEYYLPLFFASTVTLLEYLGAGALLVAAEDALAGLDDSWRLVEERYEQLRGDIERPILAPRDGFVAPDEIRARLDALRTLTLVAHAAEDDGGADAAPALNAGVTHPLSAGVAASDDRITRWTENEAGERTLLATSSPGHREMMLELLRQRGRDPVTFASWQDFLASEAPLGVGVAELGEGLRIAARKIRLVTSTELGMERPKQRQRRRRARDPETVIRELTDLLIGAPVVHEDHGVGRYRGLTTLEVDGVLTEFLLLEYAGGDKLYVPVQSLHLVTRYSGASPEDAPLHRLGSDQWAKAKRKAAEAARDTAAELLNLYAQRAARVGTQMVFKDDSYQRFALEFPFEETEDQLTAIERVLEDLSSAKPMDRVVCGDVGFGKTEVALRSAFVSVQAGFQVAVLVPTTLLAEQHHRTFQDRFAEWPVRVELLSRFRNAAGSASALKGLADGTVDIVIGTHKLLQPDLKFKRLGLVIVDEEHRFGVKHKERLKRLRAEVDMLTLTATPIPRTLNMTLGGLRDLSIIATPPADRLAVKTFVGEWNDRQVREAVLREIRRGGQIYFVHNRVENIEAAAETLRKLLPEADVRVAHGQMSERELEVVMLDFYHRQFNVLVCTTIIESGIDIPTANTIIIDRADRLGLAQLHQLRGRVGRSHHQAYAYLVAPPMRALSADAVKRLEAIESLEELGSGFALATHDLEIRGAGELLGEGQSGQIQAIGFTLYNELLGRAVAALREGREPDLEDPFTHGPEIEIGVPALIPEDYMPDVHMRLVHYKRIANASSRADLDALQVELIDRFGLLPPPLKTLFAITWLKLLAQRLGVAKIQAGAEGGSVRFAERASVDPAKLIALIESDKQRYRLDGPFKLRFSWRVEAGEQRVGAVEKLLKRLAPHDIESAAA